MYSVIELSVKWAPLSVRGLSFSGIRALSVLKPVHCRQFSPICTPDFYSTIYILSAVLIYMQPG